MSRNKIGACLAVVALAACSDGADSPRGFSLPEGNVEAGKQVLLNYQCIDCHQVQGLDVPEDHEYRISQPIKLGGTSSRVKTYGELVTSIINPSHKLSPRYALSLTSRDGQSKMPSINEQLTVAELVDLTAYLQTKYKVEPYRMSEYRLYRLRVPESASKEGS
ncbi:c-type cytochrome [Salinimonas chungwhensis]|uniref:c-type cytochrome n=1 Tax=Salinimonas chungwhensis TaxID=265425 RepID=UPI000380447A|nr:c-type cytochrome [Salinimonas chungwhensis]